MFGRALLGTKRDEPDVIGKAGFSSAQRTRKARIKGAAKSGTHL